MAQEKQQEGNNVNVPGGLNTDSSLVNQPENTTRFVFTGVNETKEGDYGFIANEESNEECYSIPVFPHPPTLGGTPYVPVGKVYVGEENNVIFLAHPSGNSIIAILDKECNLTVVVDDYDQTEKLGFKVTQQIDATFRLRRGCERTIYWVDPKPRKFVLDRGEEYQNTLTGDWDISKFNLFKTYKKIPVVKDLQVIDGAGVLPPGSYNFSVQYLDEDFNPTEFVTSTETIMIYNTASTSSYREKRGATMEKNDSYLNYEISNKAIKIVFEPTSLDTTYPFYRLAITEANAGGGLISDTKYTAEISTRNTTFYYTGTNYESTGTQAEVTMFNNIIEKAQSIEQIENRLILGDIEGKQINYCKLQKYASRINADLITKKVIVSDTEISNAKDPAAHFNGVGYMPGEIYSLGVVYIFEDNSLSPVFHIPGKNPTADPDTVYSAGGATYPMSTSDNACTDTMYIDNPSCGSNSYWGLDSEGMSLEDTPVRHHRFPLRTDHDIPFIEKVSPTEAANFVRTLLVTVSKEDADCPTECPEGVTCTPLPANFGDPVTKGPYTYNVNYTEDTVPGVLNNTIDPQEFVVSSTDNRVRDINYNSSSSSLYATAITITDIVESFEFPTPNYTVVMTGPTLDSTTGMYYYTGTSTVSKMTYKIVIATGIQDTSSPLYTTDIFGLKFSNIVKPSLVDTNGQKIIGYYIVRNERKESDRTIIDSAVLTSTTKEKNFVAQGLLFPQYATPGEQATKIKKDIVGLIYPEYKFNNRKYSSFSKIVQQGKFDKLTSIKSRTKIRDVSDGSGYVRGKHKDGESDDDGFTIQIKTRDTTTDFVAQNTFTLNENNIKELYYLTALEDKLTNDSADKGVDVFNLACDNRVGIVHLKQNYTFNTVSSLPYVYLYRDILEPYSNFRLTPYYKESKNPETFDSITNIGTATVFNGDSYISAMRYVNSVYFDTRMKKRAGKTSFFKYLLAAVLVVAAVVVAIFTWGVGTAASIGLISLAAGLVGVATTLTISGLQQDAWNKAYGLLYKEGLRETITDSYMQDDIDLITAKPRGFRKNPQDDEIQWLGDCANLWFESSINIGLRHGATDNTPDFLNAPGLIESGTTASEWNREYFDINSVGSNEIPPTTALDFHMVKKLTYLDAARKGGRAYVGLASAEIYSINPDYTRRNKQKTFNHLGLEYDCCSDCVETFPHRFHWSEQAFQEEVTDNFRMFLPNNYKDLEAETGRITDLFRIQNNLYVHTEEGLWHCPQTFQERVTSDIISFIGTGEYFSIPPRKIVDDNNSSAGNRHKWGRTKTKFGILFPSAKEKKWYLFDGQQLQPISDNGNSNYFKTHMDLIIEQQYYSANKIKYPYTNNPSNNIGVGFLSTYDTNKERLLITKKDLKITNLPEQDYEICTKGGQTTIFTDLSETIAARNANGWAYMGVENCRLKFEKTIAQPTTQKRYEKQTATVFSSADYLVFQYIMPTGYNDLDTRTKLTSPVNSLVYGYGAADEPDFTDYIHWSGDNAGFGLESVLFNTKKLKEDFPANNNIIFQAASWWFGTIASDCKLKDYDSGEPLCVSVEGGDVNLKSFVYQGGTMALVGFDFVNTGGTLLGIYDFPPVNIPMPRKDTITNSMSDGYFMGTYKLDLTTGNFTVNEVPVTPTQVGTPPPPVYTYVEVERPTTVPVTVIEYEDGEVFVPQTLNNSWTMSYSLKRQEWVGWHPYMPSFYLHVQEKFYSWSQGSTKLWKHNRPNHYQTFYGVRYPFIVEYVDNPGALATKVWSGLMFQTEAKKFDTVSEEYLDQRYVTFNKGLFYNTQQTSGIVTLAPKQDSDINYLLQQTNNVPGVAIIDRNERDWTMNSLRDIRVDYTVPMFLKDLPSLQTNYYMDKIVNPASINSNKDWTQLESFRDKFLVVRLIFDNFADTRLIFNFSALQKSQSER
jgi:hypothetical protein